MKEKITTDKNGDELVFTTETNPFPSIGFTPEKRYKIDFEKVNTLEDVILILKGMDLTVWENAEEFETLKPYLKEDE